MNWLMRMLTLQVGSLHAWNSRAHALLLDHRRQRHYGKRENSCKMAYLRMSLVKRDLGDKRAHANEHVGGRCMGCRREQASAQACGGLAVARASQRTFLIGAVAEELVEVGSARPGLEPEPCSCRPRAQARPLRSNRRSAPCSHTSRVPASKANRSRTLQYGESEDPAKMAISRSTLTERGPSFRIPNAKS